MTDSLYQSLQMYSDARQTVRECREDLDAATVPGLREWRTQRKLNLRQAAILLNVSYSFLSKVETGKPGYPITKDLADRLLENWEPNVYFTR